MKNMVRKINEIFKRNNSKEKLIETYGSNQVDMMYYEMTKSYDTTAQSRERFKNETAWFSAWEVWNK